MEDNEDPLDSFRSNFTAGVLVITLVVILVGWNEPLRYRFMSRHQIEQETRRATPIVRTKTVTVQVTPVPIAAGPTPHWMWDPSRPQSPLQREAYNRNYAISPRYRGYYGTPYPYQNSAPYYSQPQVYRSYPNPNPTPYPYPQRTYR